MRRLGNLWKRAKSLASKVASSAANYMPRAQDLNIFGASFGGPGSETASHTRLERFANGNIRITSPNSGRENDEIHRYKDHKIAIDHTVNEGNDISMYLNTRDAENKIDLIKRKGTSYLNEANDTRVVSVDRESGSVWRVKYLDSPDQLSGPKSKEVIDGIECLVSYTSDQDERGHTYMEAAPVQKLNHDLSYGDNRIREVYRQFKDQETVAVTTLSVLRKEFSDIQALEVVSLDTNGTTKDYYTQIDSNSNTQHYFHVGNVQKIIDLIDMNFGIDKEAFGDPKSENDQYTKLTTIRE